MIFVVDDDAGCRSLIADILADGGLSALSFESGEEALEAVRRDVPQAVVLDVNLPRLSGYEICQQIRAEFGQTVAIVLVSGTRIAPYDVSAGFLFGADEYIVKPFAPEELLARVRRLARRSQQSSAATSTLSSRELQVLQLLAEGSSQREIAKALFISPKTVASHIEHILAKMRVHSRAQAVAQAYRRGLLDAGDRASANA